MASKQEPVLAFAVEDKKAQASSGDSAKGAHKHEKEQHKNEKLKEEEENEDDEDSEDDDDDDEEDEAKKEALWKRGIVVGLFAVVARCVVRQGWQSLMSSMQQNRRRAVLMRRAFRIGLLIAVVLACSIVFLVSQDLQQRSQMVTIPLNEALHVEVQNCRVVFIIVDGDADIDLGLEEPDDFDGRLPSCSHHDGCAYAWYSAFTPWHGKIESWSAWAEETSSAKGDQSQTASHTRHLRLRNEEVAPEACSVSVMMESGTRLHSLHIVCEDRCFVTVDTNRVAKAGGGPSSPLWEVEKTLAVTAHVTTSAIRLASVKAGYMEIESTAGDVVLEGASVAHAGYIKAFGGDVYVEVLHNLRLWWASSTSYYCMASQTQPTVNESGACELAVNDTDTTVAGVSAESTITELANDCSGRAFLCDEGGVPEDSGGCDSAQEQAPVLALQVRQGSYYVTRRLVLGTPLDLQIASGPGFVTNNVTGRSRVDFDGETRVSLYNLIRSVLEDATRFDKSFVVRGPLGVLSARPSNGFLFGIMPARPYALMRPWLMSYISLCLLMRKVEVVEARLRTAPCPYTPVLQQSAIGDIHSALAELVLPRDENLAVLITPAAGTPGEDPAFPYQAIKWDPWRWTSAHQPEGWWQVGQSGRGQASIQRLTLSDDATLMAAVFVSCLVSLLMALFMFDLFLRGLSMGVLKICVSGSHIRRYDKMLTAELAKKQGGKGPSKLPNVFLKVDGRIDASVTAVTSPSRRIATGMVARDITGTLRSRPNIAKLVVTEDRSQPLGEGNAATSSYRGSCWTRFMKACKKRRETSTSSAAAQAAQLNELNLSSILRAGMNVRIIPIWHLPPLFAIVDVIGVHIGNWLEDSLDAFLNLEDVVSDSVESCTVLLSDLKSLYGQFCFLQRKDETNLRSQEAAAKFRAKGLQVQQVRPREQPAAFTRVRFKTERELDLWSTVATVESGASPMPGETSLDFFLRLECQLTGFDADTILVDSFKSRYAWFCEKNRLVDKVSISKALMAEKRIHTTTLELFKVVPIPPKARRRGGSKASMKAFSMEAAQKHIDAIRQKTAGAPRLDRISSRWWLEDLLVVTGHVLLILLVAIPFNTYSIWSAVFEAEFTTGSELGNFHVHSLVDLPRLLMPQVFKTYATWLPFLWSASQVCMGLFELLLHYSQREMPLDVMRYFGPTIAYLQIGHAPKHHNASWLRRSLRLWQWVSFFFQVFLMMMIISMMLVWCILGAIISPESFCAYAAAAGTLVAFVISKYREMRRVYNGGLAEVFNSLQGAMEESVNQTLRTLLDFGEGQVLAAATNIIPEQIKDMSLPDDLKGVLGAGGGDALFNKFALRQHVTMLSGSNLGKKITSAGFDVGLVVDVATGDDKALERCAEELGLPLELAELVLGVSDGDSQKAVQALKRLLAKYQRLSPLPLEFAEAIAELAFAPSRPKVEKCLAAAFQYALPTILELTLDAATDAATRLAAANPVSISSEVDLEKMAAAALGHSVSQMSLTGFQEDIASPTAMELHAGSKNREAMLALLMEVLPTLLKGILSLLTSQDYRAFMESLRFVHSTVLSQKRRFSLCFGEGMYKHFRSIIAIFHVLELVLSAGGAEEAILNMLQDESLLKLPPSVANLIRLLLWLRPPSPAKRQDASTLTALQQELLMSTSARSKVVADVQRFFKLPTEACVALELIMAFALEDHRSLVDETFKFGEKLTNLILSLLGPRPELSIFNDEGSRQLLTECFRASATLLVTLHVGKTAESFTALQNRAGLELGQMAEIVDLYMCSAEVTAQEPPPKMPSWQLMRALSSYMKIGIAETVGLAHIVLGHPHTAEAGVFIRELMRRQGLMPAGVDEFLLALLTVTTSRSTRLIMKALRKLRMHHRYLTVIGLAVCPPRYLSEELFHQLGIHNRDLLNARLDVPFHYDEHTHEAWIEWIDRLEVSLNGVEEFAGSWRSLKVRPRDHRGVRVAMPEMPPSRARSRADSIVAGIPQERQSARSNATEDNRPLAETLTSALRMHVRHHSAKSEAREDLWEQLAGKHRSKLRRPRTSHADADGIRKSRSESPTLPNQANVDDAKSSEPGSPGGVPASLGSVEPSAVAPGAPEQPEQPSDLSQKKAEQEQAVDEEMMYSMETAQLQWLKGAAMLSDAVDSLLASHNHDVKREATQAAVMMGRLHNHAQTDKAHEDSCDSLLSHEVLSAFSQQQIPQEQQLGDSFAESYGKRQLLEMQDTSTGSAEALRLTPAHRQFVEQVLTLRDVLNPSLRVGSGPSLARRGMVVQTLATLLSVGQREMALLFDLLRPEDTRDAERAMLLLTKACPSECLSERVTKGCALVARATRRLLPVYEFLDKMLGRLSWRFKLPRWLAPTALLSINTFPAQLRDVFNITHFVMSPILQLAKYNSAVQLVLYDLAMLVSGAPTRATRNVEVFGLSGPGAWHTFVVELVGLMTADTTHEKLRASRKVLDMLMLQLAHPEVERAIAWALPYLLFFAGFPFAEITYDERLRQVGAVRAEDAKDAATPEEARPVLDDEAKKKSMRRSSSIQMIHLDTGISKEVLSGMELSLRSISGRSNSDKAQFTRDSVLGLLLPLFRTARDTYPQRRFPTDGVVKALVSLSYSSVDHLEYLAEALNLNTFILQLIVMLVDISRHKDDDVYVSQMMQQIHGSPELLGSLPKMGLKQSFVALLELSFPRTGDVSSIPGLLDDLGFGSLVSSQVVSLQYVVACCTMLHMRGFADEQLHGYHTDLILKMLGGLCSELGFQYATAPALAIRLFHGDFRAITMNSPELPVFLPFALERDLATVVSGLLSQMPPTFTYEPVVLSGVVSLKLKGASDHVEVIVHTDTALPTTPVFECRHLSFGEDASLSALEISASKLDNRKFLMHILGTAGFVGPLEIRWRAWPAGGGGGDIGVGEPDWLRKEQHARASQSLRRLEKLCWNWRIHWGGMAGMWWDQVDVHPLFLLLANGDVAATRLAADLVGLPEEVLTVLFATVSLASPVVVDNLLLADMCIRPTLRKVAAKDQLIDTKPLDPPPTGRDEQHAPYDAMPPLEPIDVSRQPHMGLKSWRAVTPLEPRRGQAPMPAQDADSSSDDDGGDDDPVEFGAPPERALSSVRSAEDLEAKLKFMGASAMPDEMRVIFEEEGSRLSELQEKFGQALWTRWRCESKYTSRCSSFSLERATIDCFKELWGAPPDPEKQTAPWSRMQPWQAVPQNMHLLTSLVLLQLYHLLEPSQDLSEGVNQGPSVALMVCLSRLNQARRHSYRRKEPMTVDAAESCLIPAMLGLEVHLRHSRQDLRQMLAEEMRKTSQNATLPWQDSVFQAFTIPDDLCEQVADWEASRDPIDWMWDNWKWPMDELAQMCARVMQVSRLALGVAEPLVCIHPSDKAYVKHMLSLQDNSEEQEQQLVANTARKLTSRAEAIMRRGWERLLDGDDNDDPLGLTQLQQAAQAATNLKDWLDRDLQVGRSTLMEDLLNAEAMSLILALAAGGADAVDGFYSISSARVPRAAQALEKQSALYDAMSSMLTTSCDEVHQRLKQDLLAYTVAWYEECSGQVMVQGVRDLPKAKTKYEEVVSESMAARLIDEQGMVLSCTLAASDKIEKVTCTSAALLTLMPREHQLSARSSNWSNIICPEVGLDISTTETMLHIAHQLVEDRQGLLINMRAFKAVAKRLRLGNEGSNVLQALSTPTWDAWNAEVLGKWLGCDGTLLHGILLGSVSQVHGWVLIEDYLSLQATEQAAASAAKATPKANNLQVQRSKAFTEACYTFDAMDLDQRGTRIRDQRRWLDNVVATLLPFFVADEECWQNPEKAELLRTVVSFLLHLIAGQNSAAIELLLRDVSQSHGEKEEAMAGACEASRCLQRVIAPLEQVWNLRAFILVAGSGADALDPRTRRNAAKRLGPPILAFVNQKAQQWEWQQELETKRSGAECGPTDSQDVSKEFLESRMFLLLELVLSMAASDTPRCLQLVKEVCELNLEAVVKTDSDFLLKDPSGSRCGIKRLAKAHFAETERRQIISLIVREDAMKALVLMQGLRSMQKLRESRKKKNARAERSVGRGAYALNSMVNALHVHLSRSGAREDSGGSLEAAQSRKRLSLEGEVPTSLRLLEAGLGQRVNSTISHMSGSPQKAPSMMSLASRWLSPTSAEEQLGQPGSPRRNLTSQEEGLKAMGFVFIAFAASRRGELQTKSHYSLEQYIEQFELLLPVLSSLATGRLELFLLECRALAAVACELPPASGGEGAATAEGRQAQWIQVIDLVIDIFTFLGMDTALFMKMINGLQDNDSFLLPTLFQVMFDAATEHTSMTDAAKQELKGITNLLGQLLLCLGVGAPPDVVNSFVVKLVNPLEAHAKKLLQGNARMERASIQLISSTRKFVAMAAEGKSLQQMELFKPGEEGEPAPAIAILQASMQLLLPLPQEQFQEPLEALVKGLTELSMLRTNPTMDGFQKHSPVIAEQFALALGAPEHTIIGIVGLVQGNWEDAANLCRPFCNINPEVLNELIRLLPAVKQTVSAGKDMLENLTEFDLEEALRLNSQAHTRRTRIAKKLGTNSATVGDLFTMVDLDGNGSISRQEFSIISQRLGYKLSEHRVIEIFSRCKKTRNIARGEDTDLNEEEFEAAMQYLQGKIAMDSLKLLGISWTTLMLTLAYLTTILVLIFLFIFLGISVFVTTGTFGTIVNSIMTIAAGLGLSKSSSKESGDDLREQAKTKDVVAEVKDTVFNHQ